MTKQVLLNPAPAVPLPDELYQGLGHLIINESEAVLLSGKPMGDVTLGSDLTLIALHFLEKGVKNVIITLGATVSSTVHDGCTRLVYTWIRAYFITLPLEKMKVYLESS